MRRRTPTHAGGAFPLAAAIGTFLGIAWLFLGGLVAGGAFAEPVTQAPDRQGASSRAGSRGASPWTESKEPIHVTSDRMEADNKKNVVIFIGNVSAVQGDFQIQSDRLEVYIKEQKKGGAKEEKGETQSAGGAAPAQENRRSVERMVAIGNVLINEAKKKFAAADRLDYNESTRVAVLTGNPRAWEGNNQVVGNKIEMYLGEDRTVVHGSTRRRVSVTLFPAGTRPRPPADRSAKGSDGR